MSSSHQERKAASLESALVQSHISNKENTMKAIVSNSIATGLLRVMEDQVKRKPNPKDLLKMRTACVTGLEKIKEETKDAEIEHAIHYILEKIKEPPEQFDTVILDIQSPKNPNDFSEEKHVITLSTVLATVYSAMMIKGNKNFHSNYDGLNQQELEDAKRADEAARRESFFNCLKRIASEQVCHHGVRGELAFLLNGIYKGVNFLTDPQMSIYSILKENINALYWEKYHLAKPEDKQKLRKAYFYWMEKNNPSEVLSLIDPNQSQRNIWKKEVDELFIKNNVNPKKYKIDILFDEACRKLEFTCDSGNKEIDKIYLNINKLINYKEMKNQDSRNIALNEMQKLVKLCDPETAGNREIINNFIRIDEAFQKWHQFSVPMSISDRMNGEDQKFPQLFDKYFQFFGKISTYAENKDNSAFELNKVINESVTKETLSASSKIEDFVRFMEKEQFLMPVTNFFAHWQLSKKENDKEEKKNLYEILLNDTFQNKAKLNDAEIEKIIEMNKNKKGEMDITPYIINRVFLTAILFKPQDIASESFRGLLENVLGFVKKKFSTESSSSEIKDQNNLSKESLFRDSYPKELLDQLNYILEQQKNKISNSALESKLATVHPKSMILIPENIKTFEELIDAISLLKEKNWDNVNKKNLQLFKKVIAEYSGQFSFENLMEILKKIPINYRYNFLTNEPFDVLMKKVISIIEDSYALYSILELLPENQRESFLLKSIGIEKTKSLIESDYNLRSILELLPESQRENFLIKSIGIEKIKSLIKYSHSLERILKLFPEDQRENFLMKLMEVEEIKILLKDCYYFCDILKVFPESQRENFLMKSIGIEKIKSLFECELILLADYDSLVDKINLDLNFVLSYLPKNLRIKCESDIKNTVKKEEKIKNNTSLAAYSIFPRLVEENKTGIMTLKKWKEISSITFAHRYTALKEIDTLLENFHKEQSKQEPDQIQCRQYLVGIAKKIKAIKEERPNTRRIDALAALYYQITGDYLTLSDSPKLRG